jgi:enoyl-CoA hydratase
MGDEAWGDLQHLSVERQPAGIEGAVLVTLDLPDRRNAMSEPMTDSWQRVMAALRREADLRVVVVTGRGRAFCAGGDFSWIGAKPGASVPELRERMLAFYGTWLSVRELEVPTVAAVNGAAIGAGLAIALACDVRVVAEDARLAAPFTSLGIHPGMATTWLIRRAAGDTVARDMLLTGRALTGAEGVACGLMSRAVPGEQVLESALEVARTVAAAAPVATRLTKAALGSGGPETFESALAWEAIAQPVTLAMEDLQEGLAAAQQKRAPSFTGR